MKDRHQRLEEQSDDLRKSGRCFLKPRPVQPFGEPIQCVDTPRYLGLTHGWPGRLISTRLERKLPKVWEYWFLS